MPNTTNPFASDADLETATNIAERFALAGSLVRPIGKEVLASLELGGLPDSTYERLARMCHNKNVDHKRNAQLAKDLSQALFGCVIECSP
jgi:hypothetical protein